MPIATACQAGWAQLNLRDHQSRREMSNQSPFIQKMRSGQVCLGTCITFSDPAVTEAVSANLDFVWIEMEHNPVSLETVQAHIIATSSTKATPLVRVAWNDPVLIKPVLDI